MLKNENNQSPVRVQMPCLLCLVSVQYYCHRHAIRDGKGLSSRLVSSPQSAYIAAATLRMYACAAGEVLMFYYKRAQQLFMDSDLIKGDVAYLL